MIRRATAAAWLLLAFADVPAHAGTRTYVLDPGASLVTIHVGKAGLFKFAGHDHEVLATSLRGEVVADAERLDRSSVALNFDAAALKLSAQGEPPGDVPKVQEKMIGPDVLDIANFPTIAFLSKVVAGRETSRGLYDLRVTGDLSLHGATRTLTFEIRAELSGDALTATGHLVLKHSDFGLSPVSVAGVVKVKNEIAIDYRIVARAPR